MTWIIATLSGALLGFAQPPWHLAPLAVFALAPWFVALAGARTAGAALLGSFAVGLVYGVCVATWIPDAIRELGGSTLNGWLGLAVIAAWGKGVPFALFGVLIHAVRRHKPWLRVIIAAAAIFAIEQIYSHWKLGLPWALLGHSQWSFPGVSQLAAVGGVPLISALLAALNQSVALCWETHGERGAVCMLVALSSGLVSLALFGVPLSIAIGHGRSSSDTEPPSLLLVQPNIPRGERWAPDLQELNLERVISFTEHALKSNASQPDAIVWPENLLTVSLDGSPALSGALSGWIERVRIPVILGVARSPKSGTNDSYRSSILWLTPEGIAAEIDKTRGVPLFESGTELAGADLLGSVLGGSLTGPKVEEATQAGPLRGTFTVTPILCYEALFPSIAAGRRTPDSVAILNLADDSWTRSPMAREQLLAYASFRAIELRLPLVRVAHGGLTAVIDPYGRVVEKLPLDAYAFTLAKVAARQPADLREKIAIAMLPLATAMGVWWASAWVRRSGRDEGGPRR